ncbi:hypothetical protein QZH41_005278 [Actinostola sp. cb2023]|nr:hypothetical protein QZH41_005278 [Actinostola sp. cb2023]
MNSSHSLSSAATFIVSYEEPKASVWFRQAVFGIVIVSSLIGNFVVVKAFRQHPHLKKPCTYYVVTNLAIAELVGTVCLPFFQVYDELMTWPFGDSMCRLVNAFMLTSYFVIPWSLAAIAFLSGPTFMFAVQIKTVYNNNLSAYWCIELFPGDTLATFPSAKLTKYYFTRFILNFALPGVIIVVAYGGVAKKLQRHLTAQEGPCNVVSTSQITSVIDAEPEARVETLPNEPISILKQTGVQDKQTSLEQLMEMEGDLLRMIYIAIIVYLICYIPYQTLFLLEYFNTGAVKTWRYFMVTRKYAYLLTCFPSALHPICYGTMKPSDKNL